jgi:bifunctional UDP-N-acetylglucosamine pyrophosphorylase/glucosamine-1-phosphate N-acetyltransferase
MLLESQAGQLSLLTFEANPPAGFGRIIRDSDGSVTAIVEERDASVAQKLIGEVNSGIMAIPAQALPSWLRSLGNNNDQGEYYLTDIIALAHSQGVAIRALMAQDEMEVMGVNDKVQLALLERHLQKTIANDLMKDGVTLRDPARIDVRGTLHCGQDVVVDVNSVFEGEVSLGDGVSIGPNCVIKNARIAAGTVILAGTNIEDAEIGPQASIGPLARLRPGTRLGANTKIGNFVETKNAIIGDGSKANHLAYLGDVELGSGCNIGAGTIVCNYDGVNKHKTKLGDNVFIGSNSVLIAPVKLADNAFVAAGSAVTSDVPSDSLAVARVKQRVIAGWKRPSKG